MSIYENCLLVSLIITMPPKTKKARGESNKVERANQTVGGKVAVVKSLYSKQDLKPLDRAAEMGRMYVKQNSLPFGKFQRIIPADQFFKFSQEMGEFKAEFDRQKQKFLNNYFLALSRAEFELGSLYEESNYPTEGELDDRIHMAIETNVVSPTNAFDKIAGFDEESVAKLKQEALEQHQKKLQAALKSLVERLLKTLRHAVSKLSVEDAVFRNTLVSNIQEAVETIRNLNITNDKELDRLADKVEEIIGNLSAEDLRKDPQLRKETVEETKEVMDKLSDYF